MTLSDFKLLYLASCILLGLIILSPTIALVVKLPGGEGFSELYLLGPGHMTEGYPFNVSANTIYKVFLGVTNHMGGLEDYVVYVKVRNNTESLPDSVNGTASVLEPFFEYRATLGDGGVWEKEFSFAFDGFARSGNFCRVSRVVVDDFSVAIDKIVGWNNQTNGFYFELFFELWRFNSTTSAFGYDNRFVGVWLNFTMPS